MGIPIGRKYTVTMKGSVTRQITCEKCEAEYEYDMERSSKGSGSSLLLLNNSGAASQAEEEAEDSLKKQLKSEHDPVPCPCCGWYQKVMIPFAKRQLHRWMTYVGFGCLAVGIFGLVVSINAPGLRPPPSDGTIVLFWVLTTLVMVAAVGQLVGREIWAFLHEPNKVDKKTRIRLGKKRSRLIVAGDVPSPSRKPAKSRT